MRHSARLSKAGGLTVSEVLARGVPLLLPTPLAGQERWNADYMMALVVAQGFAHVVQRILLVAYAAGWASPSRSRWARTERKRLRGGRRRNASAEPAILT